MKKKRSKVGKEKKKKYNRLLSQISLNSEGYVAVAIGCKLQYVYPPM
jgi:hypothetical protein